MEKKTGPNIRELYPHLNDDQFQAAEENLGHYLENALRIYDRISSDPKTYAQLRALFRPDGTLG